ncbi:MAG: hypothetical protein ACRD1J_05655 [Terriglobia bacterium]
MAASILAAIFLPCLLSAAPPAPVIPAGTRIDVQLTSTLSTSANQDGDPFTAKVEDPIFAGGQEVIPAGSTLYGHVTFVKPPGRVKGKAEMRLVADYIMAKAGKAYSFRAQLAPDNGDISGVKVNGNEGTVQGAGKSAKSGAEETGIGAAAGAGVGAMAAGGTGALYGAGIGALAGVIHSLAKHHKNVVLHPGTNLSFVLLTAGAESKLKPGSEPSMPFVCANCR